MLCDYGGARARAAVGAALGAAARRAPGLDAVVHKTGAEEPTQEKKTGSEEEEARCANHDRENQVRSVTFGGHWSVQPGLQDPAWRAVIAATRLESPRKD